MKDWKLLAVSAVAAMFAYASDPQAHGASRNFDAGLGIEREHARLSLEAIIPGAVMDDPDWIAERLREDECCSAELVAVE